MARRNVDYVFRVDRDDVSGRFRTLDKLQDRMESKSAASWNRIGRTTATGLSRIGVAARRQFTAIADATLGLLNNRMAQLFAAGGGAFLLKQSIGDLAELGDQMTGIAIKLRQPVESLEDMRRELLAFSNQRGITDSAENMARAVNTLVGADFAQADAMNIAKAAAMGAAAAQTDSATVTRGLTSILKGFRIESERSNEILGKMIRATDLGVVEMEDLSNAMVDLVGPAIQVGASIEEVLALLETLSISGVSNAAEASTAIARMLERFGNTEFRKKMVRFGIQVVDEEGNFKSPVTILEMIRERWKTLNNDVKRSKFLHAITGGEIRAKRALLPLLENMGQVKQALEDISNSGGRLEEAFAESQKRLSAKLGQFKNVLKDVGMAFTEAFLPTMEKISAFWNESFPAEEGGFAEMIRRRNEQEREMSMGEMLFERSPLGILAKVLALSNQDRIGPPPPQLDFSMQRRPPMDRSYLPIYLQPKIEVNARIEGPTGKIRTDVQVSDPNEWGRRVPLEP